MFRFFLLSLSLSLFVATNVFGQSPKYYRISDEIISVQYIKVYIENDDRFTKIPIINGIVPRWRGEILDYDNGQSFAAFEEIYNKKGYLTYKFTTTPRRENFFNPTPQNPGSDRENYFNPTPVPPVRRAGDPGLPKPNGIPRTIQRPSYNPYGPNSWPPPPWYR